MIELSILVPCYNDEDVLSHTNSELLGLLRRLEQMGKIGPKSRIYYVDDGSKDHTWESIENLAKESNRVVGIKLSRNRGHQNAVLAGLLTARGDAVVSLDSDLQDDINVIEQMLDELAQGAEIVYGVRNDRSEDSFFKRNAAQIFYKLLGRLGVEIVYNHADFRLLSRRAIEELRGYREVNIFLRGIVPQLGFKTASVHYKRRNRVIGESKYTLGRLLALAWQGITSTTILPLRMVTAIGAFIFTLTIIASLIIVVARLFGDRSAPGWASIVLPIFLLGGIQILCIGIIGEYLAKIFKEVQARPRFIIEKTCGEDFSIPPNP